MQQQSYRRFGALSSSADPSKLGTTVQGLIMGFAVIAIFIAGQFGIQIGSDEMNLIAVQLGEVATTLMIAFGLIRKLIVWISEKWNSRQS